MPVFRKARAVRMGLGGAPAECRQPCVARHFLSIRGSSDDLKKINDNSYIFFFGQNELAF